MLRSTARWLAIQADRFGLAGRCSSGCQHIRLIGTARSVLEPAPNGARAVGTLGTSARRQELSGTYRTQQLRLSARCSVATRPTDSSQRDAELSEGVDPSSLSGARYGSECGAATPICIESPSGGYRVFASCPPPANRDRWRAPIAYQAVRLEAAGPLPDDVAAAIDRSEPCGDSDEKAGV